MGSSVHETMEASRDMFSNSDEEEAPSNDAVLDNSLNSENNPNNALHISKDDSTKSALNSNFSKNVVDNDTHDIDQSGSDGKEIERRKKVESSQMSRQK